MTDLRIETVTAIRVQLVVPVRTVVAVGGTLQRLARLLTTIAFAETMTASGEKYIGPQDVMAHSVTYRNPMEVIFGAGAATAGIYKLLVLLRDWRAERGIKLAARDKDLINNLLLLISAGIADPEAEIVEDVLSSLRDSIVGDLKKHGRGLLRESLDAVAGSKDVVPIAMSIEAIEPVAFEDIGLLT